MSKLHWTKVGGISGWIDDNAPLQVNPDWVAAGPEADVHFCFHPGVFDSPWSDPKPAPVVRETVEPAKPHSRPIFKKVYKGPGYPVDPRNERARALEGYVNAFALQKGGVFDHRPLRAWLNENVN